VFKLILTGLGLFGFWKWVTSSAEGPGLPLSPPDHAKYWLALRYEGDPSVLKALSAEFKRKGYVGEAAALLARANLPTESPTVQGDHAAILQGALRSQRPEGIHKVSIGFEQAGKGASARLLRRYARGLRVYQSIPAIPAPQPPPPAHPPRQPGMHGEGADDGGSTGEGDTNTAQHGTEGVDYESAPNEDRGEEQ